LFSMSRVRVSHDSFLLALAQNGGSLHRLIFLLVALRSGLSGDIQQHTNRRG
jgi:hypothetical protein